MSEPDGTGYSLREAVDDAIAEGRAVVSNANVVIREQQRIITDYEQLLGAAMLRLCDLGDSANSSALVRAIRDALA
jgi:hypothetical protein